MSDSPTSSNKMTARLERDVNDLKLNPPSWLVEIQSPTKPKYKCPKTRPSPLDAVPAVENNANDGDEEMRVRATVRPQLENPNIDFGIPPIKVELDIDLKSYASSEQQSLPRLWVRSASSSMQSDGGVHPKFYEAIQKSNHKGKNPIETVLWHFVYKYLGRSAELLQEEEESLRFQVGDEVVANVGHWEHGTVIATWDEGFPYRIRLHSNDQEVHAPYDMDQLIKAVNVKKNPSKTNNGLDEEPWPDEAKLSKVEWMDNMRKWENAHEFSKHSPEKELFEKTFKTKWIVPEVREWLGAGCNDSPDFADEIAPNVFSFPLFTAEFCNTIISEYERCEKLATTNHLHIFRPNSMNNYGAILKDIGFQSLVDSLQDEILSHIAAALFPLVGSELTEHHCFLVRYAPGEDLGLDMHVDDSDITFNVCLGKEFTGAGLQFCGKLGSPEHRHQSLQYKHSVGRCVVHLGAQRHGADDIVTGERINLISWNRNKVWRRSRGYLGPMFQLDYEKESGPPDVVCLSKTHDVDWEQYRGPRGAVARRPWCPPDFARYVSESTSAKDETTTST